MPRRAVVIFFVFCLLMGVICLRLISVSTGLDTAAGAVKNTRSIELSDLGAPIYDCKGRLITNGYTEYFAAARPTAAALSELRTMLGGDELELVREKLSKGRPVAVAVPSGANSSEDVKIIGVGRRYSPRQPAAHIVGYTDSDGNGVCGIEKAFESIFKNNRQTVSAVFPVDAYGRVISGAEITTRTDGKYGKSGVYLTLDLEIQQIVEDCMDECGVDIGAVVVLDPKTGAVRACASRPVFDSNSPAKSLSDSNSPFINRALCAFAVGSVFKPAVAAAALEQGISPSIKYDCTGVTEIGGVEFGCYEHKAHGVIDMCGALERSCNAYFIHLAQKLDREKMISTLSNLGFGKPIDLCEGMSSASGYLPNASELDSKAAVANLAFGQGSLTASPLTVCAYMSCIANGGAYCMPYLVEKATDGSRTVFEHENRAGEYVISGDTASLLSKYLRSAVENGNGRGAKPRNTTAAGKTATAQTGKFERGEELYNTWFSGWFPAEKPRYVITVFKERGSGGASDCAPVFKAAADKITALEGE